MQTRRKSARTSRHSHERRARVLKALAHPARLRFIEQLAGGERCVCELTATAGTDVSTVSRHLAMLRRSGVLASERRGQKVFYRLNTPCVLGFLDCVDQVLDASASRRR